jgi:hypothetical protein
MVIYGSLLASFLLCTPVQASDFRFLEQGDPRPVVVLPGASERTIEAANRLAEMLGRMTGRTFSVESGDGSRGIVVATVADLPEARENAGFQEGLRHQEEYLLRSESDRLLLVGSTSLAARHAVWDLLHRLGYRQYFPGPSWEIVPTLTNPSIEIDEFVVPAFTGRRVGIYLNAWPSATAIFDDWRQKNRIPYANEAEALQLRTHHIYSSIINRFSEEFEADPTMRSIIDGKPTSKLNPANPRTLEVVEKFVLNAIERNPAMSVISMDPSDGGGWGSSPEELAIGTPSDRALFLANHAAEFVNRKFGEKYVGILAYNHHSPPPTRVRVHPRVMINVANGFIKEGLGLDDIFDGWRGAGAEHFGIYEYWSIMAWDFDEPGRGRTHTMDYLARTIPEHYARGARFYAAEMGVNFGPKGLPYYFGTRALWNLDEASRADEIREEFLTNCFPGIEEPVRRLYEEVINPPKSGRLTDDHLARAFEYLTEARKKAPKDEAVLQRLDDLARYIGYLHYYQQFLKARTQESWEEMMRFSYRIGPTGMISSRAQWSDFPRRFRGFNFPEGSGKNAKEEEDPLKDPTPVTRDELDTLIAEGLKTYERIGFEVVNFSQDLVPATLLPDLNHAERRIRHGEPDSTQYRRNATFYVLLPDDHPVLNLGVLAGATWQNRGPARFSLFPFEPDSGGQEAAMDDGEEEADEPVHMAALDTVEVEPDREWHDIQLTAPRGGIYQVVMVDNGGNTRVRRPVETPFTIEASESYTPGRARSDTSWFYVPKGTEIIGAVTTGTNDFYDPSGKKVFQSARERTYISIPVPKGADGKAWRVESSAGELRLLTVPPYLAPTPQQLLLPREVIEAEAPDAPGPLSADSADIHRENCNSQEHFKPLPRSMKSPPITITANGSQSYCQTAFKLNKSYGAWQK